MIVVCLPENVFRYGSIAAAQQLLEFSGATSCKLYGIERLWKPCGTEVAGPQGRTITTLHLFRCCRAMAEHDATMSTCLAKSIMRKENKNFPVPQFRENQFEGMTTAVLFL